MAPTAVAGVVPAASWTEGGEVLGPALGEVLAEAGLRRVADAALDGLAVPPPPAVPPPVVPPPVVPPPVVPPPPVPPPVVPPPADVACWVVDRDGVAVCVPVAEVVGLALDDGLASCWSCCTTLFAWALRVAVSGR
jgi:hypothetical protein